MASAPTRVAACAAPAAPTAASGARGGASGGNAPRAAPADYHAGGLLARAAGAAAAVHDGRRGGACVLALAGGHAADVTALRWAPDAPSLLTPPSTNAASASTGDASAVTAAAGESEGLLAKEFPALVGVGGGAPAGGGGVRHGARLATGDARGTVVVWDVARALPLLAVRRPGAVVALEWCAGAGETRGEWLLVSCHAAPGDREVLHAWDTGALAARAAGGADNSVGDAAPVASEALEAGVRVAQLERDPWDASRLAAAGPGGAGVVTRLDARAGRFAGTQTLRVRAAGNGQQHRASEQQQAGGGGGGLGGAVAAALGGGARRDGGAGGSAGAHHVHTPRGGAPRGLAPADVACAWSRARRGVLHLLRPRELLSFDLARGELAAPPTVLPAGAPPLAGCLAAQPRAMLLLHADGSASEWTYRGGRGAAAPQPPVGVADSPGARVALVPRAAGAAGLVAGAAGAAGADLAGGARVAALAGDGALWLWRGRRPDEDRSEDEGGGVDEAIAPQMAMGSELNGVEGDGMEGVALDASLPPLVLMACPHALAAPAVCIDVLARASAASLGAPSARALACVATSAGGAELLSVERMAPIASLDARVHSRAASAGSSGAEAGGAGASRGARFLGRARLVTWTAAGDKCDVTAFDLPSGRAWPLHGAGASLRGGALRCVEPSASGAYAVVLYTTGMEVWDMGEGRASAAAAGAGAGKTGGAPRLVRTIALSVAGVCWLPPGMPPPRGTWAEGEEAFAFAVGDVSVPLGVFGVREGRVVDKRAPPPPQGFAGHAPTCIDAGGPGVLVGDNAGGLWRWLPSSGALDRLSTGRAAPVRAVRGALVRSGPGGASRALWAAVVYADGEVALWDVDRRAAVAVNLGATVKARIADVRWLPPAGETTHAAGDTYMGAPRPGPRLLAATHAGALLRLEPHFEAAAAGGGAPYAAGVVAAWRQPLGSPLILPPGHQCALKMLLCRGAPLEMLMGEEGGARAPAAVAERASAAGGGEGDAHRTEQARPAHQAQQVEAAGQALPPLIDFGDDETPAPAAPTAASAAVMAPAASVEGSGIPDGVQALTPHEAALLGGLRKLGCPQLLNSAWGAAFDALARGGASNRDARAPARLALAARLLGCADEARFWTHVAGSPATGAGGVAEDAPREVLRHAAGADIVAAALLAGGAARDAAAEAMAAHALEGVMPQM